MSLVRYSGTNIAKALQNQDLIVVESVKVAVRDLDGNIVSLYKNSAGTTPKTNPFTTDNTGQFFFYVEQGEYIVDTEKGGQTGSIQIDLTSGSSQITPETFGAVGDDVTDDSLAIQEFFDYIIDNNTKGYLLNKIYKITVPILIKSSHDWGVQGSTSRGSVFKQYTPNTPILQFSEPTDPQEAYFNIYLTHMGFDYDVQPLDTDTLSNPLIFNKMWFNVTLDQIFFLSGHYAIKVTTGVGGTWGSSWDNLTFGSGLVGGAIDWTGATNAVPNNNWGRFFVDAKNMTDIVFKNIRGYNTLIGNIEILSGTTELFRLSAGSEIQIGAIKLELGTYTTQNRMFGFESGTVVNIGQIDIGGTFMDIAPISGAFNLIDTSLGGSTGGVTIDFLRTGISSITGNAYIINGNGGNMKIKKIKQNGAVKMPLQNASASNTAEWLTIEDYILGRAGQDTGDSDLSVELGNSNIITYQTKLTQPRFIDIDANKDDLFNGAYYKIIIDGAVNKSNTLTIRSEGVELFKAITDKQVIDLVWRRNASNAYKGWVVTSSSVDQILTPELFGAKPYPEDSTEALQFFLDYVIDNNLSVKLPSTHYAISSRLLAKGSNDWAIIGSAFRGSKITQLTDDEPILQMGLDSDPNGSFFNVEISNIEFGYESLQPTPNTAANAIYFAKTWFKLRFYNLTFNNGFYGIKVKSGVTGPRNSRFDEFTFGGDLTGGAIDWSGVPKSNYFGSMTVDANSMFNPVFNNFGGDNFSIELIEISNVRFGAKLMTFPAGSKGRINKFLLNGGTFTSSTELFGIGTGSFIEFNSVELGGQLAIAPSSGDLILFDVSQGGATGKFTCETLLLNANTFSGSNYIIRGSGGPMRIGTIDKGGDAWKLQNWSATDTSETLTVDEYIKGRVTKDRGNFSTALAVGDDNYIIYETSLSSDVSVLLPSTPDDLFNGIYYSITSNGAVNTANQIKIFAGGALIYTILEPIETARFTFRRESSVQAGWKKS